MLTNDIKYSKCEILPNSALSESRCSMGKDGHGEANSRFTQQLC
jgi:hypothetical protein